MTSNYVSVKSYLYHVKTQYINIKKKSIYLTPGVNDDMLQRMFMQARNDKKNELWRPNSR